MKKLAIILCLLLSLVLIISCDNKVSYEDVSIVVPSGTPALGIATYIKEHTDSVEIVEGSAIPAAFTNASSKIIIAPVTLGAKFYNTNGLYKLFNVYVKGNLFIVYDKTKETINSISDLEGKNITSFQKGSTPEIVLGTILKSNSITAEVTYLAQASDAMSMLMSGTSSIVVCAEPALSKIRSNDKYGIIDLQEEWTKVTGKSTYPQAAVFVRADCLNDESVANTLGEINKAIVKTHTDRPAVASAAASILDSFKSLGEQVLYEAIPHCNFMVDLANTCKSDVEFYFSKIEEFGYINQIGGKVPGNDFFAR